jgi:NADH:ubiquinone oxidoreductase subunit 6 (subunit J)
MTPEQIAFALLAILTVGGGIAVAFSARVIHAAFSLLFTFIGVAGLYVLLAADFLAVAQLIIYVGGILVLILFGVMLTQRVYDVNLKVQRIQPVLGGLVALVVLGLLVMVVYTTHWNVVVPGDPTPTTTAIGHGFMKEFVFPFEFASVVLLIALVGAAVIARRHEFLSPRSTTDTDNDTPSEEEAA